MLNSLNSALAPTPAFEDPIRSVIFSASELERHGESLAHAQKVTANAKKGENLLRRVKDNARVLEHAYLDILKAAENKVAITPAAEWMIDNFHIVRSQLRNIHDHLPPAYYRELPKIAEGPLAGFPRVYGIAWAFAAHTDSRFDPELLQKFITSYQKVQPLTIGELWAVSTTIQLVFIENLRRLAVSIVASQKARENANRIADEFLNLKENTHRTTEEIFADLQTIEFVPSFAVQLLQRLRFQEAKLDPVLSWLEQRLQAVGRSAEEVATIEHVGQTGANATVRNIITSFRLMTAFDWQGFFESVSLVEQTLRQDALYSKTDFTTRDRYRHAIEEVARRSPFTENQIAGFALEMTSQSPIHDLGHALISKGRKELETKARFKPNLSLSLLRWYTRNGTAIYLGSILALTLAIVLCALFYADQNHLSLLALLTLGVLGFFPAAETAIAIVNRATVGLLGPRYLPRLDLESGIPREFRSFVVVPTMLSEVSKIEAQVEQLEI
ncbi:MAG: hypothetical protein EOP05_02940, partial [Proteobacteria bacterium]